ncbi:MAG: glycosyltransferase family 4 protein [Desulfobulbaceae bacterium]|nr:glycosyltransferase family 4 protein [Desulfobulbaceae bacterium]
MNILLLAPQPFYQERGTPIAVKLLAQTLGELGHDVHLLVFAEGESIEIANVTIHRHIHLPGMTGIKPGISIKKLVCDAVFFIKCFQLVRRYNFHIIHAVEESVFMAIFFKKIFKIPYVYDMDSCMSAQLIDKFPSLRLGGSLMAGLEKSAIVNSDGVVAVCSTLEDMALKYAPGKLTTRLEDISLLDDGCQGEEDLRLELGIQGTLIMYVGNLEKYQGIDLLLESFKQAVDVKQEMHLVLIGGNERDISVYRQKVRQLNIDTNVTFCGPRPVNMLGFYLKQADILVSPRIHGSNTPMKIYSYLDSGVSVLATNLPTHTQVLDERIAFLVEPQPARMAAAIGLLAEDKVKRDNLGLEAQKRVHQEYSLPAFKRKLSLFYEKL